MRYGLPYQGSKNKLAERIVALLPPAKHLYDVFAGGCAVSHCALLSGKWECVHFSDTNDSVALFKDCLEGNIPDGSQWISREEFEMFKDFDPYIRIIWSFGNNQRNYLYSREIEPYKKAVHEMIFAPTPTERRLKFREVCKLMPLAIGNPPFGGADRQTTNQRNAPRGCLQTSISRGNYPPPPRVCYDHQSSEAYQRVCGVASQWRDGGVSNCIDSKPRRADAPLPPRPFAVGSMR